MSLNAVWGSIVHAHLALINPYKVIPTHHCLPGYINAVGSQIIITVTTTVEVQKRHRKPLD